MTNIYRWYIYIWQISTDDIYIWQIIDIKTIILTVHDDMGGRLALWYHIYGSLRTIKNIPTNNLISENIFSFHQFNRPPVSSWTVNCFDVYGQISIDDTNDSLIYNNILLSILIFLFLLKLLFGSINNASYA